jgi:imidazolonepropionase-like amidohydrolase
MNAWIVMSALLHVVAIEHVQVEVGDGRVLQDVTVVIDGDRIISVGSSIPANATRVDGRGKILTPGFIDVASPLGLREVDLEPVTVDESLKGAVFEPAFRVAEGFNPLSIRIPVAREEGVTSAVLAPRGGVLSGLGHAVMLTGSLKSVVDLQKPMAMFGDVGSGAVAVAGGARGGLWLKLREAISDARFYVKNKAAIEQNRSRALSLSPVQLEALSAVLSGKMPLVLNAHRASDILEAIRFAGEEKVRLVVSGGSEAWLVADELKRANVPVLLVPSEFVPNGFDRLHARDDAGTLLDAAGVQLVLGCADFSRRRLRQEAGIAVAYGLPRNRALTAITLGASKVMGMEKEVGSIEAGKRADVVLWSGDPLELASVAEKVWIAGTEQPQGTRQSQLVERYMRRIKPASPK